MEQVKNHRMPNLRAFLENVAAKLAPERTHWLYETEFKGERFFVHQFVSHYRSLGTWNYAYNANGEFVNSWQQELNMTVIKRYRLTSKNRVELSKLIQLV